MREGALAFPQFGYAFLRPVVLVNSVRSLVHGDFSPFYSQQGAIKIGRKLLKRKSWAWF
jgi:hypothetical protein